MKTSSIIFCSFLSSVTFGSVLSSTLVHAHETGDFIVRAGFTSVQPDDDSSGVNVSTVGDVGMKVGADSSSALGLNLVYMVNQNWAVELLAATPFSHDIDLSNTSENTLGLGDGVLGETKQLPPTLSALYYFQNSDFQPYVGVGVNYTVFFEDDFVGSRTAQTFTDLDLDDSFGLSAQVGFDYHLKDNWLVNASVRYIDIETEASFQVLGLASSVDVDINPWVYSLTLGYQF